MKMIVLKCDGFGVGLVGKGNGIGNMGLDIKIWLSVVFFN